MPNSTVDERLFYEQKQNKKQKYAEYGTTAKNRVLQQVKIIESMCLINIRLKNKLQFYKTVSLSYTILHKKVHMYL